MTICCTVTVTTSVPVEQLKSEDRNIAGNYAVTFEVGEVNFQRIEGDDDPIIETAKDIFHNAIGIANLDDFEIGFAVVGQSREVPEDAHWLT